MKAKIIVSVLILSCLISRECFAQAPTILWQKSIGGSGLDSAVSMKVTFDGGYIIVGSTKSNDGDVSGNHGGWDVFVGKLTSTGQIEWTKTLGGSGTDQANWIEQTKDSGYVIAGITNSANGDITQNHGSYDGWLIKLNKQGQIAWQKTFGGADDEVFNCIKETTDGGYIVGGSTSSNDGDLLNLNSNHSLTITSFWSATWLLKLDKYLNIQWQKINTTNAYFGGSGGKYSEVNKVVQTFDKGYVYSEIVKNRNNTSGTGYTILNKIDSLGFSKFKYDKYIPVHYVSSSLFQSIDSTVLYSTTDPSACCSYFLHNDTVSVAKYNKVGNLEWKKQFKSDSPNPDDLICTSVGQIGDNIFLAADTRGKVCTNCNLPGNNSTNNHNNTYSTIDFWIFGLSSTGNLLWQKCYGGTNNDHTTEMQITSDSNIVCFGTTRSNDGDVSFNHGNADMWIFKLTKTILPLDLISFTAKKEGSKVLLSWITANEKNTKQFIIQKSIDGINFIDIGSQDSKGSGQYYFIDKLINNIDRNLYYRLNIINADGTFAFSNVIKFNSRLVNSKYTFYPNPSKKQIQVSGDFNEIKITDLLGKTVFVKRFNSIYQNQLSINLNTLYKGIYFISFINGNNISTEKLILE